LIRRPVLRYKGKIAENRCRVRRNLPGQDRVGLEAMATPKQDNQSPHVKARSPASASADGPRPVARAVDPDDASGEGRGAMAALLVWLAGFLFLLALLLYDLVAGLFRG
jgi:hypothetical protein